MCELKRPAEGPGVWWGGGGACVEGAFVCGEEGKPRNGCMRQGEGGLFKKHKTSGLGWTFGGGGEERARTVSFIESLFLLVVAYIL
jgi:hypothetical protein